MTPKPLSLLLVCLVRWTRKFAVGPILDIEGVRNVRRSVCVDHEAKRNGLLRLRDRG